VKLFDLRVCSSEKSYRSCISSGDCRDLKDRDLCYVDTMYTSAVYLFMNATDPLGSCHTF
jgi:hypothetical protein